MRFSKNASLNLSINAIVILILAITMLGLGLGFMREIFGSATEEFTKVSGTVQKQMIDQMKQTNKIVDIDRPKISVKKGEKEQVYLGFKNVQTPDEYFGIVYPDGLYATANPAPGGGYQPIFKSTLGVDMGSWGCALNAANTAWNPCSPQDQNEGNTCCCIEMAYKTTATTAQSGEVIVVPLNIKSHSSSSEGTCFFDLVVCESDTKADVDGLIGTLGVPVTACPSGATEHHIELTVDVTV